MSTYVHLWLIEDEQATSTLVQDTMQDLVKDHLRQSVHESGYKQLVWQYKQIGSKLT